MPKLPLFLIFSLAILCFSCQNSISNEAKSVTTNFMDAYNSPMNRAEMSKLYSKFSFRKVHTVKEYQIKNYKKISDREIHANIETTTVSSGGQQETKLLRLILTKETDSWKITDSKGIGNLVISYAKEFGFGMKAGCFTKNIETLTDQQFLGKINRANLLITQLAQKESGNIAPRLSVIDLTWKAGEDNLSGEFSNKTEYSFREVGYLVRYYDAEQTEIGNHNDILKPVKRGFPFNPNQDSPFSNRLPKPIPEQTKKVDIQFFINPNEISDRLITKAFTGKECAGIQ